MSSLFLSLSLPLSPSLPCVWLVCVWTGNKLQDREKIPKQHLAETVEELKRFNARRKLKGAVQAIAGGLANDPLCGTDTDSGACKQNKVSTKSNISFQSDKKITQKPIAVTIGIASETLNDWADEEAGLEAVQRVLDSLDDIHALQDEYVDEDVLRDMLSDNRLSALLQVHWNLTFDNLFV